MIKSSTGLIHTIAASVALVSGLVIFVLPKATSFHRAFGYVYSLSMVVMLVSAFLIYHLTKSFNLLHVFAIVSCPPLILGFRAAFTRRSGWLGRHYHWMCYSYLGLCAALVAEVAVRVVLPYLSDRLGRPSIPAFWLIVGVCTYAAVFAGGRLIERNRKLVAKLENDQPTELA